jgi:hypothetical protein
MTVLHLGQEKQVLGERAVLRIGRHDHFLVPTENRPGIGQHDPILNPQAKALTGQNGFRKTGTIEAFLHPQATVQTVQNGFRKTATIEAFPHPQATVQTVQNGFRKTATETEAFPPDLSVLLILKEGKTESESQDHSQEEMRGLHAATIAQVIQENLLEQNQEIKTPLAHRDFRINHPHEVPASQINPVEITRAMPKENQADRSKREVLTEILQGLNPPARKKREGIQKPQKEKIDQSADWKNGVLAVLLNFPIDQSAVLKRKVQAQILHLQHAENHR